MSVLLGTELNASLIDLFEKRISTVIVATVDREFCPHTAPFNHIVVKDSKNIRIAISRHHQTYTNIMNNGYVAISVLDEGDIAVSIKGFARIVRNAMDNDYNLSVVEVEISEIKKDNSVLFFVTQGIRTRHKNEPSLLAAKRIFQELGQMDATLPPEIDPE